MCGIIGYTGRLDAKTVLLEGLKALEYRGYDSAGIALQLEETNKIADKKKAGSREIENVEKPEECGLFIKKKAGPVDTLIAAMAESNVSSHCGIGHTRWATHGGVSDRNAHPHSTGLVTLIHNGIIENYKELTEKYGFADVLLSETDSEVACRVIDYYYRKLHDPEAAIWHAVKELRGTYSFCILFRDKPGSIYCIRAVSPLVAAWAEGSAFVASDVTALIAYTKQYFIVPEHTLLILRENGIELKKEDGSEAKPELLTVDWDIKAAQKNGYPHFMLKEIYEQPTALRDTFGPRIKDGLPDFSVDGIPDSLWKEMDQICIVACGTASYAGMVGRALMEPMLRIPVSVHIASEFRYEEPVIDSKTLCIVISQSGETIDTLKGLQKAKEAGAKTLAVVNIKGSSIAREADYVLYTHAGPEISVASTKAYIVQLAAMYLLCCRMAMTRGKMNREAAGIFMQDALSGIPAIEAVLENPAPMKQAAAVLKHAHDAFYIGRGLDYAFSLEGALKLKEISYIHAEAYAAGELKHGTIALIEKGTPVIAIATQEKLYEKTISNVKEVRARGAYVILITKEEKEVSADLCDMHLKIRNLADAFTVFPVAVILQLIAYETTIAKGLDVDKPRNLAKSVTVE